MTCLSCFAVLFYVRAAGEPDQTGNTSFADLLQYVQAAKSANF